MVDARWREFLRWSRLIASVIDLEESEHHYKREQAERLRHVRVQFLGEGADWAKGLATELNSTNLLDWRLVRRVEQAASDRPDALTSAVGTLWSEGGVDAEALGAFDAAAREALDSIGPGDITALGSVLLMARESSTFPPYRATPVATWRKLVGGPAPKGPVARYQDLLSLTDELLRYAPSVWIPLTGRLEAQGLAWAVLQSKIDDLPISDGEKREFASWRDGEMPPAVLDKVDVEFASHEEVELAITGDDTRRRIDAQIYVRRGQSAFRQELLRAYHGRCAVTGSTTQSVLEAAHISPYRGDDTHELRNGLLLRADIHTLFDLHLLTVAKEGRGYTVHVSPEITETAYRELDRKPLRVLPKASNARPHGASLGAHNAKCAWHVPIDSVTRSRSTGI